MHKTITLKTMAKEQGKAQEESKAAEPQKRVVAHGMSREELDELRYKQNYDEAVPTVKAANSSSKDYAVPQHEEHMVHISMEAKVYSQKNGEKLTKPRVQKFYPQEFGAMEARGAFKGYTVDVLHMSDESKKKYAAAKKAEAARLNPNKGQQ